MVEVAHSKNHTFLIGQETVYGTAVTADKDVGLVQNVSPADKKEVQRVYATGSREPQELVSGKVSLDFDKEVIYQNGRLFEYMVGGVAHVETTGDWKHTFSFAADLPSFTMESSFNLTTDQVFKYNGCKLLSGVISIDTNGLLTGRFTGRAKDVDTSSNSASSAVISTLKTLHYKHLSLSTGVAASETDVGLLQNVTLTFNSENTEVPDAGQVTNACDVAGNIDTTMEFTITFQNVAEYERFTGADSAIADSPTQFSMIINAHNGVTLGSGRREFFVQLDDINYEEVGTAIAVGETVTQTFKGTATGFGSSGFFTVDNIASSAWA